jgi:hypothetical protein
VNSLLNELKLQPKQGTTATAKPTAAATILEALVVAVSVIAGLTAPHLNDNASCVVSVAVGRYFLDGLEGRVRRPSSDLEGGVGGQRPDRLQTGRESYLDELRPILAQL